MYTIPFSFLKSNMPINNLGNIWTDRSMAGIGVDISFNSSVYGNGIFLSIGRVSNQSAQYLMTSNNGIDLSFTRITSLDVNSSWHIAYGNGKFVACALDKAAYSTNGTTWTVVNLPTTGFQSSSIVYGNGRFVVVNSANQTILSSLDGVTWTVSSLTNSSLYNSVTYGNGKFVAVGRLSTWNLATSTDGINWTQNTIPTSFRKINFINNVFMATTGITSSAIGRSSDGVTWTTLVSSTGDYSFTDMVYENGMYIVVCNTTNSNITNSNIVRKSVDGTIWTSEVIPRSSFISSVARRYNCLVSDGNVILGIGVGYTGASIMSVLTSP